jgi:hypothetical protein
MGVPLIRSAAVTAQWTGTRFSPAEAVYLLLQKRAH